ncbi:Hpt domain-containing protein [Aureimonas leprariae]|uniref:HPt domain-containing protein n=1 Tax=Plantimonas leprariae TaxID=2615207 RepID=A0A7V7PQX6_9HYPH|nr:Hpt domain-containing protein [Aureimonas leprariae]KAB0680845.1 hypothetical protein F6X38_07620 [Aureimonas leprariae]
MNQRRRVLDRQSGETAEAARPSRARPIDLVHLAGQTLGDRALEREILGLMAIQVEQCSARLGTANDGERRSLAHAIKGAARNIGAFALADRAEVSENHPGDSLATASLLAEMQRTGAFIRTLLG